MRQDRKFGRVISIGLFIHDFMWKEAIFMPKIIVLGTKEYEESGVKNYGDCFIIDLDLQLYLYDCGSIEHAERVLKYMEKTGHHRVTIILSHNDGDHYDGINYLLEKGVVEGVYTILLYKHKYLDQLREIIGDDNGSVELS